MLGTISALAICYKVCIIIRSKIFAFYSASGCRLEEFAIPVPCVDTYRSKPKVQDCGYWHPVFIIAGLWLVEGILYYPWANSESLYNTVSQDQIYFREHTSSVGAYMLFGTNRCGPGKLLLEVVLIRLPSTITPNNSIYINNYSDYNHCMQKNLVITFPRYVVWEWDCSIHIYMGQ